MLENLQSAEFNFLTLVKNSPDLVLIFNKNNGKIVFVNKNSKKIFGLAQDEVIDKTLLELNLLKDKKQWISLMKKFYKKGEALNFEIGLNNKNGETIYMLTSISNIKIKGISHLFFSGKNITEIKEKQLELTKLSRAIEQAPVSIFITDVNEKIVYCNPHTTKISGFMHKEIIGNTPRIFKSGKVTSTTYKNIWDTILSGKTWRGELLNKNKNGKLIWDKSSISPILNTQGEITNFVAVKEDITERKKIIEDLIVAKDKAEESNQLKTEFLNNMSHEIRTPLNGILGFSEFLNDPELSQTKREQFIKVIKQSGNQLMRIIDDILEISMLGTKKVRVIESAININDLLMELYQVFSIKAKEKDVHLYFKKELIDKNAFLLTDEVKLKKILSNLLENALKFTHEGSIELNYQLNKKDKNNQLLEILIKDSGIGIAKEKQQTIFERFAQAEKELSKKVGGIGLGLSIAKENADLLGGNIMVDSELGKGTTFTVSIPYKPTEFELILDESNKNVNFEKCKMLIAEDEEYNFMYLETLILDVLKLNCDILHAKNGEEAIELFEKNKKISIVLMDLKMPVMSGYEATKILKQKYPNLPIIAQTAYSSKVDRARAFDAGCDEFISKPINTEEFKNILFKYKHYNKFDAS